VETAWTVGGLSGIEVSLEAWRRALHACGCDDESLVHFAQRTHHKYARGGLRLFDDVTEMFISLPSELPLALITNGASDTQRGNLLHLGLEHHFEAIVVSGETGIAKPDSRAFRAALNALDLSSDGVWHVGDNLLTDVGGATGAGLTAVWLNRRGRVRGEGDAAPDHEIQSLKDLVRLVSEGIQPA
jgi:putative hydrolase of the HAD superfamily